MDLRDPVVWQGLAATGVAAFVVVGITWWLYMSPVRGRARPVPTGPRLAVWLAGGLGVASLQFLVGGLWDASQHIRTGVVVGGSDFLWPSHIVLYSSFLLSFAAAGIALAFVALPAWRSGDRDPRVWVRRQPYLGTVALASAYEIVAIPGDALWHQIFGVDLTAWSPPHLMLAGMMGLVLVGTVAMLLHAGFPVERPRWVAPSVILLLGLALNVFCLVGVLEWELPTQRSRLVLDRPIWLYPSVFGGLAFFTFVLARVVVGSRWAATQAAVAFYVVRLALTLGLEGTGNVAPALPPVPLLGALLLDLVGRGGTLTLRSATTSAAAFTIGFAVLAVPGLTLRADLPAFGATNDALAVVATFVACLALFPMTLDVGRALRGAADRSKRRSMYEPLPAS